MRARAVPGEATPRRGPANRSLLLRQRHFDSTPYLGAQVVEDGAERRQGSDQYDVDGAEQPGPEKDARSGEDHLQPTGAGGTPGVGQIPDGGVERVEDPHRRQHRIERRYGDEQHYELSLMH